MTTPAWPTATVPVTPRRGTFQEASLSNRLAFAVADGVAPKVRRRFTSSIWRASWQRHYSQTEAAAFWTFYKDTLKNGTLKFTLAHPVYGTSHTWRFAPDVEPAMTDRSAFYVISIELLRLD